MNAIIDVAGLCFGFERGPRLLEDLSFQIRSGDFLGIVGPNGVGKTTLLQLLCAQLMPCSGSIRLEGRPVHTLSTAERARRLAVVRQQTIPAYGYTVAQTVLMARTPYLGVSGFEGEQDKAILADVLAITDTAHLAHRALWSLSGGERQRVFIARALAQQTDVLLLDEPTSYLDLKHQIATYNLLKTAQSQQQHTVVAITHDINLAAQYCNRVLLLGHASDEPGVKGLSASKNYFIGTPETVLTEERLARVFGVSIASGMINNIRVFVPVSGPKDPGKML